MKEIIAGMAIIVGGLGLGLVSYRIGAPVLQSVVAVILLVLTGFIATFISVKGYRAEKRQQAIAVSE